MPDIFDRIAPSQAAQGDIFDHIAAEPEGDVFDRVAPEELPFLSGENRFFKLLDLINTPQQMLIGALTAREGETVAQAAERGARENVGGFALAEKLVPVQEDEGEPLEGFFAVPTTRGQLRRELVRPVVATLADLLVDPLVFVPLGKVGKGIQETSRAVRSIPAVGRAIERAEPVLKPLARLFSRRAFAGDAERSVIDIIELNRAKLELDVNDIIKDASKREQLIHETAKSTGRSQDDIRSLLVDLIEEPRSPRQAALFAPVAEANDALNLLADAPAKVARAEIGVTSFKGDSLASVRDAIPLQSQPGWTAFTQSLKDSAPEFGVTTAKVDDAFGIWQGAVEPSAHVVIGGEVDTLNALAYAARHGSANNQDAVILFLADRKGVGFKYTIRGVDDPDAARAAMQRWGIDGGTIAGRSLVIYDFDGALKNRALAVADSLGKRGRFTESRGFVTLVERGDYERITEAYAKRRAGQAAASTAQKGASGGIGVREAAQAGTQAAKVARQGALFPVTQELRNTAELVTDASRGVRAEMPNVVQDLAKSFKDSAEDVLLREQSLGLNTPELADSQVDYLLHLLTPAARRAVVNKFSPQFGRAFSARHASQLARDLRGLSVKQINELAARGQLPGFEGLTVKQFLVDDPVALESVRKMRSAKAIADLELLQTAAVKLGRLSKNAPAHWVDLAITRSDDPRVAAIADMFKDIKFDPDVAQHLNNTFAVTMLPEGLDSFLRVFDSVQDIWKGITLAPFPAYHLRNVVGNVWNNALAGVYETKWYRFAEQLQRGQIDRLTLAGKEIDAGVLRTLMRDMGVSGGGRFAGEVPSGVSKALGRGVGARDLPGAGRVVQKGFEVGGFLEDNARIAHFLKKLDEGQSPIEAALSVKKYLFDYTHGLTDFERRVLRRVFPFYAWTRFNVPLQASALVDNPRPFVHLAQIVRAARADELGTAPDEFHTNLLPGFIRENSGIPIRTGADGNPEYFLLGGWLPAADLEILARPSGALDKALNLLSPLIKTPIEQGLNKDIFRGREIEEFPGEKQQFLGIPMRRRLVHFLKMFRFASEVDRLTRGALESGTQEEELTELGKVLRAIFGLKTSRVSFGRQARRRRAAQEELRRKALGIERRGDEAENVDVLVDLINNPEELE